jgi:hypothetical protein
MVLMFLQEDEYCRWVYRQISVSAKGREKTGWVAPWPQKSMYYFLHDVTISEKL